MKEIVMSRRLTL